MLTDNDRALLQLIVDQVAAPDFELRLIARSLLAVDAELGELRSRVIGAELAVADRHA